METDDNTPLDGTASHTIESAADAIAGLLDPEPDTQEQDSEAVEAEATETEEVSEETESVEDETADPNDEEESDDTEVEESQVPQSIKLDDGTEITLEEVKKGYLRQSDYTKKAQALAQDRQQVEALKAQITPLEQQTKQALEQAWQIIQANTPQKPPASLATEDPFEYQRQHAIWEEWAHDAQAIQSQHQQMHQRAMAERQAEHQKLLETEKAKLLQAIPELADPAKREKIQNDVLSVLPDYGFSAEDLSTWTDSRALRMAYDAAKWRMLQKTKPKVMEKAKELTPVAKPGARPTPTQQKAKVHSQKVQRLRSTGRVEDAASAIADLL